MRRVAVSFVFGRIPVLQVRVSIISALLRAMFHCTRACCYYFARNGANSLCSSSLMVMVHVYFGAGSI